MLFKEIPGLQSIKNLLIQSVARNKVAHGLLLDGYPGAGNLALAWAFATYLFCENRQADDACGQCPSCRKMANLAHPDFHLVFPFAKTHDKDDRKLAEQYLPEWRKFMEISPYQTLTQWLQFLKADNRQALISVEEARNIIRKLVLKSYEGGYKILLIWKPELMNPSSANALLKVLEEPTAKTIFILVSDQSQKLLPTIISRVQQIWVPRFTDEEVRAYLTETLQMTDEKRISEIIYLSDGNLAEALTLSRVSSDDRQHWFQQWMRDAYKKDLTSLVDQSNEFDKLPKEKQKDLLEYSLRVFRDIALLKTNATALVRAGEGQRNFLNNFANTLNVRYIPPIVNEISTACYHIESNVKAKIVFLDLSLTLCQLLKKD